MARVDEREFVFDDQERIAADEPHRVQPRLYFHRVIVGRHAPSLGVRPTLLARRRSHIHSFDPVLLYQLSDEPRALRILDEVAQDGGRRRAVLWYADRLLDNGELSVEES